MKFRLIQTVIALSLLLTACGGDDDGSPTTGGDDGEEPITASYTATITTEFTEENFPQDYPNNASFGPLVVITHAADIDIYSIGEFASDGFKAYVENGDVDALGSFIAGQVGEENEGRFNISTSGTLGVNETADIALTFTPTLTRVTIISNLNPSPDWFIGIDSFDIVDGDELVDEANFSLTLLDAGSRAGTSYNSSDTIENSTIGNSDDAPFSNGEPFLPQIAFLNITRN